MWVARDKDSRVALWHNKPYRSLIEWKSKYEGTEYPFYLIEETFSDLKWEDEPIEVSLVTKEIDEEKLDKLAWESVNGYEENTEEFIEAFKLGYCKAMEK